MLMYSLMNIYQKRNSEHFKKLYVREFFISHFSWYIINAIIFTTAVYLSP